MPLTKLESSEARNNTADAVSRAARACDTMRRIAGGRMLPTDEPDSRNFYPYGHRGTFAETNFHLCTTTIGESDVGLLRTH